MAYLVQLPLQENHLHDDFHFRRGTVPICIVCKHNGKFDQLNFSSKNATQSSKWQLLG